jgi:hypothetical protein
MGCYAMQYDINFVSEGTLPLKQNSKNGSSNFLQKSGNFYQAKQHHLTGDNIFHSSLQEFHKLHSKS